MLKKMLSSSENPSPPLRCPTLPLSPQAAPTEKIISELLPAIWYRTITEINSKQMNWWFIAVSLPVFGKDKTTDYRVEIQWELIW